MVFHQCYRPIKESEIRTISLPTIKKYSPDHILHKIIVSNKCFCVKLCDFTNYIPRKLSPVCLDLGISPQTRRSTYGGR